MALYAYASVLLLRTRQQSYKRIHVRTHALTHAFKTRHIEWMGLSLFLTLLTHTKSRTSKENISGSKTTGLREFHILSRSVCVYVRAYKSSKCSEWLWIFSCLLPVNSCYEYANDNEIEDPSAYCLYGSMYVRTSTLACVCVCVYRNWKHTGA